MVIPIIMAKKKTAAPAKVEEKPVEPKEHAAQEHQEVADVKADKSGRTIPKTGRCEVAPVAGGFRIFNEEGVAVSPVVAPDEKDEEGRSKLSKIRRDCSRMNALQRSRIIRTPAGHKEAN